MSSGSQAEGPAMLDDVVVLDVGDEATTLAGELLAELGALVVRVEDLTGDELRRRGRLWNAVFNAGKRSVGIDTTTDAGWAPVLDLVERGAVDVVIGPIEPNPAIRRFLDRVVATIADQPALGVVDVVSRRDHGWAGADPGGGDDVEASPRAEPVTDLTLTAAGGLTWLCGEPEDPPNQPAGDLGWKQTSLAAAEAAMALVTSQRRCGRGGHIVVSAQEAVALTTLQTANGNIHHWSKGVPSRHAKLAAHTTVRAGDGRWTSFTIHPPNWPRFVEWADRVLGPTGLDDPRWLDLDYVATNRKLVAEVVASLAAATPQADLISEGQERGLLVLPVNEVSDVVADRHLAARRFWVEVDDGSGPITLAGSAFRSNLGRMPRPAAPALGADDELLESLAGPAGNPARTAATPAALWDPVRDESPAGPPLPLAGVRIVDFCWAIAGSLTTRFLADLGADVIKIESDNRIDPIRYIGPQPPDREGSLDTNGVFNDCGANKRAVTLNVDTAEGRDLARRLIATADVVTANYTPDRLDRWGFDWDSLQALRPGLIVANLAVMGTWGPDAGWRSYGSGLVAMCGLAAHTGFEGRVPECLGTLHTDFTVPYFAATQILAALHHRDRTGKGALLELSQYESAVRLLDTELAEVLNGGPNPGRRANRSPWAYPHGVFPSAGEDRWVAIAARNDTERAALATVIGVEPTHLTDGAVARWTATRSREDAAAELGAAGVPVSPVEDLADHHTDPAMATFWQTLDLPAGISAEVVNQPFTWDGRRLPLRPAPMWFEHTHEILVEELGLDPDHFAQLLDDGVLS
jgi:crotonobetainyl-CoA:carnitine CoA-transferase CaiB-like acyl-CoA transferase